MADEADKADEQQSALMSATIKRARDGANFNINGTGLCQSCSAIEKPDLIRDKPIIGRWYSPVELDIAWLLVRRPLATEDEQEAFAERVAEKMLINGMTEELARNQALEGK